MKNVVIVKLNGGLGNQMFQYAFAYIIALQNNSGLLVDESYFRLTKKTPGHTPRNLEIGIFEINKQKASREQIFYFEHLSLINKIRRKFNHNYPETLREKNFSFDQNLLKTKAPVYLIGYFQSFKYFSGYEDKVKMLFKLSEDKLDDENRALIDHIKLSNSVSVHIRRGDYVEDKITQEFHGNCSREYYDKAISKIRELDEEVEFFFFSDDIKWVENEFRNFPGKKTFIGSNVGKNSWKDLFLMSNCKHNIIANSSFSWWSAWLNNNDTKIVVAPKRWFNNTEKEQYTFDLIPDEWIRI